MESTVLAVWVLLFLSVWAYARLGRQGCLPPSPAVHWAARIVAAAVLVLLVGPLRVSCAMVSQQNGLLAVLVVLAVPVGQVLVLLLLAAVRAFARLAIAWSLGILAGAAAGLLLTRLASGLDGFLAILTHLPVAIALGPLLTALPLAIWQGSLPRAPLEPAGETEPREAADRAEPSGAPGSGDGGERC